MGSQSKPSIIIGILGILFASGAPANGASSHEVSQSIVRNGPLQRDVIENDITQAALEYENNRAVDRFVESDVALPRDAKEYTQFRGYGVLLLVAISHNRFELPLPRVYLRSGGRTVVLHEINHALIETPENSPVRNAFGQFREDVFFLLPLGDAMSEHQLLCDFALNRSAFVIDDSPVDPPGYLTPGKFIAAEILPAMDVLEQFIIREWPGVAKASSGQSK